MKKFQKNISVFVVFVMIFSLLSPAFSVWAAEDYSDYIPAELTDNIILKGNDINALVASNGASGELNWGSGSWKENDYFLWREKNHAPSTYWGAGPTYFTLAKGHLKHGFENGQNYVLSVRLKNDTVSTRPQLSFAVGMGSNNNPLASVDVSSSEYATYTLSFTANKNSESFSVGLNQNIDRSSLTDFGILNMDISNGGSLYVAKEAAYDITNVVSGSSSVYAGESVQVKTQIVNQIGKIGTLSQDVTYKVLNAERTAEMDGFGIVYGEDGTATISISETVPTGDYVILASSTVYEGFRKGATISVIGNDAYDDYVVSDMPENLLSKATGYGYTGSNSSSISSTWYNEPLKQREYTVAKDIDVSPSGTWAAEALSVGVKAPFIENTNYVYSTYLKSSIGTPKMSVAYQVSSGANAHKVYTNEYGASGYTPLAEFSPYKVTFNTGDKPNGTLWFGFVSGSVGEQIIQDLSKVSYLGIEEAYNINAETIESNVIFAGGSTAVKAEVVNQIGTCGSLAQNFTWTALNSDRSEVAPGITITPTSNGTATVNVAESVAPGKYIIFAASQDYKKLRKGVEITVEKESSFIDYVPNSKPANLLSKPHAWSYTSSNSYDVDSAWNDGSSTERRFYATKDFALKESDTWAVNGFSLGNYTVASPFEANTSYVYSTYVKTVSGTPKVNIAFQVSSQKSYLMEYGAEGYTPNADYEQFRGTFSVGDNNQGILWFGLSSATAGDAFCQDFSKLTYLAKEAVYDISVKPVGTMPDELKGGDTITMEAMVLNQIGLKGTCLQNFEWLALKDGKTAITSDIKFTIDSNSSRAVATLDKNIENGTYYILAKSKDYENFVRTYEIVVGAQDEYTPGEIPQNMVTGPGNVNMFEFSNGAVTTKYALKNNEYYSWQAKGAVNTYWKVGHTYLSVDDKNLTEAFVAGKNYIISARLKNEAMDVNPSALFGVAIGFDKVCSIPVTSSEYNTYNAVVTSPENVGFVSLGFDGSVDRSTLASPEIITIDLTDGGSLYIAEEVAYDIKANLTSESTVITKDGSITASAEVVNQLGIKGKLNQDFTWKILDSNKTNFNTGFSIDVSEDSTSVTVTAGNKAPYGTYYLAVYPNSDSNMVRLIKFKLKHDVKRIYVSPEGDDQNSGTLSSPFKTITKAKEAVFEIHDKDSYMGIEVVLRGGEYRLSESIDFNVEDSGTAETPVIYKAYEGEKPVIKGSVVLDTSKMRGALSSDIVPRLHPDAEGKVMVIDLQEQGLSEEDIFDMSYQIASFYNLRDRYELNAIFTDGVMQTLSQWPNDRAYSVRGKAIVDEIIKDANGKDVKISTSFNYTEPEPDRWSKATGWYIGAFMPYDYSYARLSVKSLDTVNKVLAVYGREGYETDFSFTDNFSRRWKAFNLLEEIDLPGEYCLDSENNLLYYYPPYDMEDATLEIATMFDNLVTVNGASDITFSGIGFAQTNGVAIYMRDVYNVDVDSCTFEGIGGTAVIISGSKQAQTNKDYWQRQSIDGSYNCDVRNNVFVNLAGVAITVSGGNVDTLTKANNIVENNFIYDYGNKHLASASGAISVGGCGVIVRNNNISVSPGIAILLNGNDHIIEYNEIYDVMREVADAGAVYQGRNAIARGSAIRYNYIHDLRPTSALAHSAQVAIYLDDCQHDLTIENNIIKNVMIDFNSNGAAAFTFSGNTTVDVDKAWNFLNHASTKTSTVTAGPSGTLEFIESQIYDKELYFERYPELEEFLNVDRVPGNNPKYFTVARDNIAVNVGATNIQSENLAYSTLENNEVVSDSANSIFVDPLNGDYRIKSTSPYAKSTRLTDSFNIDTIGIQTEFTIGNYGSFDTIYPKAGDTVSNKNGVTFVWNIAPGANKYILTVASDKNFENVVHTESTGLNTAVVNTLDVDTTYYWKVDAVNTSRELADIWACANGVSHFTVRDYEATISSVTMDTYDTLSLVNAKVTNSSSDTTEFDVVFAAYGDGKLVASQRIPQTIPKGQSININTGFDTEGKYIIEEIKIFVWGKDSLVPYARARVLK